jgi:1,4-alpha-glucan branching enzyme
MGNEFGHPEWIDFPREGNNWSFQYARRQWHLLDAPDLKYRFLAAFDRDMLALARRGRIFEDSEVRLLHEHSEHKILAFTRGGLTFVFNFHPSRSFSDYRISSRPGRYREILDSDDPAYGGFGRRAQSQEHLTLPVETGAEPSAHCVLLYLPSRTAVVLSRTDA